jgi:hypothetical protein
MVLAGYPGVRLYGGAAQPQFEDQIMLRVYIYGLAIVVNTEHIGTETKRVPGVSCFFCDLHLRTVHHPPYRSTFHITVSGPNNYFQSTTNKKPLTDKYIYIFIDEIKII